MVNCAVNGSNKMEGSSGSKNKYKVEYANLEICRGGERMLVLHNERDLCVRDKNINKDSLLSTDEKRKAVKKIHTLYDRLLEKVKLFANSFSTHKYSKRYWEIILGKIIMGQVSHIYERVLLLNKLNKRYEDLIIDCVSDDSYRTPSKTIYHKNLSSKWLEAQYYSQASLACDIDCRYKNVRYNLREKNKRKKRTKNTIKTYLEGIWYRVLQGAKVGVRNTQLKRRGILKLAMCTGLNIKRLREVNGLLDGEEIELNKEKRKKVKRLFGKSRLDNSILKAISHNIPKLLLEGHEKRVAKLHGKINIHELPKIIICGRTSHPPFLLLKAEATKKNRKIFSIQHGGSYGEINSSAEKHERSTSDRFITWGWKKKNKDTPMPASKMLSNKKSDYTKNKKILWISRSLAHYSSDILNGTMYKKVLFREPNEFLKLQSNFYNNLSKKSQKHIHIRFKSGIRSKNKLRNKWIQKVRGLDRECNMPKNVNLEKSDSNMISQSKKYGLRVVDHFGSTSFLQFIGIDIPVILFDNIEYNSISNIAKPYYRELENVGVFHRTSKSAAKKADKVRHNVEDWWKSKGVQKAIKKFRKKFAWNPDDGYSKWCEMINEL